MRTRRSCAMCSLRSRARPGCERVARVLMARLRRNLAVVRDLCACNHCSCLFRGHTSVWSHRRPCYRGVWGDIAQAARSRCCLWPVARRSCRADREQMCPIRKSANIRPCRVHRLRLVSLGCSCLMDSGRLRWCRRCACRSSLSTAHRVRIVRGHHSGCRRADLQCHHSRCRRDRLTACRSCDMLCPQDNRTV